MAKLSMQPKDFKGKRYAYPPDHIDPKKKRDKQYYLDVNQALYADYVNNRLAIPYSDGIGRSIEELQAYATGRQSPDKIKHWLLKKHPENGQYISKMNVSFEGYAKLPQLLDIMRSKNMNQEFDVRLTCIDENSMATIEATKQMLKFVLDVNTQKFLENSIYKPDLQPDPAELGLRTAADVDTFIDTGGFTLQWQIAAEAACAKSKMESHYKMFQDQVMDDLITNPNGICGAKTYIEKSTKIPKFRRVDMRRALVQPSIYRDFNDNTRAAELRDMSMTDISRENPNLTPQQLYDIALTFQWMNPPLQTYTAGGYSDWMSSPTFFTANDPVMSARIFVLDSQWLSVDTQITLKNERGFYRSVDYDYKLTAKDAKNGDQKIEKKVIKKYYSQWIVGSEILLDYGVCEDVVYYGPDGNKRPRLDFFFAQTGNMSLVERCTAIIDDMNMILVKYRNGWASLPASPAMAIQQNLIENVMLNNVAQQPEDIMRAFVELGVLYYNSLDDNGDPLFMAGGAKPIEYMNVAQMASVMSVCSQELLVKANELRDVLGLQNGADGGQKSPYQGLGETELAFQAANASLQPTFNSYNYLFRNMFTDIIKKWQIVAKDGAVKLPYAVLGEHNMKMLELGNEFTNSEFNVEIAIAPSSEERMAILQQMLQLKTEGFITHAQYLFLYEKIMAGQIKSAYFQLAKMEAQREAKMDAQKQQDIQANGQIQQQSLQMKGQIDGQLLDRKGQIEMEKTMVEELVRTNRELYKALIQSRKPDDVPPNTLLAQATITQNTEDVAEILMGANDEAAAPPPPGEEMAPEETMAMP
jgi:hypothetical protein